MGFFQTFAECAITFAGFAAVHGVLQGSTGPRGVLRSFSTVLPGLNTFLLALLPLMLVTGDIRGDALWQISSWIALIMAGFQCYMMLYLDLRLARLGYPPQAPVIVRFAQLSASCAVLLFLYNAVLGRAAFPYGLALVLLITQGILALMHSFWLAIKHELEKV